MVQDHGFLGVSFASPLKAVCEKALGVEPGWLSDRLRKDVKCLGLPGKEFRPRDVLIQVGTNVIRALSPDVWIQHAQLNVISALVERGSAHGVVITDCRFRNELAFADGMFRQFIFEAYSLPVVPFVVRIVRPDQAPISDMQEYIPPQITVNNCGTLNDLEDMAHALYIQTL